MPDMIVICANGLQAAYLGAYGNPWIHTPNLDRLASEGFVFDNHYPDNLTTLPTRRSWWSGKFTLHDPEKAWGPMEDPMEPDLLNQLRKAGVQTTIVSDCPYINDADMGYTRQWNKAILVRGSGYDTWIDPAKGGKQVDCRTEPGLPLPPSDDPGYDTWRERWNNLLRNRNQTGRLADESKTGVAQVMTKAADWLDNYSQDQPFFLWLDLFCPHGPWDLPEKYRDYYASDRADQFEIQESGDLFLAQSADSHMVKTLIDVPSGWVGEVISDDELIRLRKTYAGAVTLLDQWVGYLIDTLQEQGRLQNTVLVFVSDQGEPLGEHGFVRRPVANTFEELTHTPLIIRWPGVGDSGQRRSALVQSVELPATALDVFGLKVPESWHGKSLRPMLENHELMVRDFALIGMDCEVFAIRTKDWLYVESVDAEDESGQSSGRDESEALETDQPRLYAKPEDRWDQNDVASMEEDVVSELSAMLQKELDRLAGTA